MKKLIALQPFLEACGVNLDKLSFEESVAIVRKMEHQLDIAVIEVVAKSVMQDSNHI